MILFCMQLFLCCVDAGSHSLWAFATFILGDTQFPQFTVVLMLDDIQVGYFHSDETGVLKMRHITNDNETASQEEHLVMIFKDMFRSMKNRVYVLKDHLNSSEGINVQQRLAGCEFWDSVRPDQIMSSDAFNGVGGEALHYLNKEDYSVESTWTHKWTQKKQDFVLSLYRNVYLPVCIRSLKIFLKKETRLVLRRVKPRVRLLQKTLPDSGGVKVTCLATGFYPRHINLTLLRDGQPVSDHQITGGELLPNGDETYQMRKSLEVSAEELQHHHYTCTADHLSLDNKLDIDFEREQDSLTIPMVSSVVVLLCLFGATCVTIIWKKRRHTDQGSQTSIQSNDTATSSTENKHLMEINTS